MPKTATGKIQRRQVAAAMLEKEKAKAKLWRIWMVCLVSGFQCEDMPCDSTEEANKSIWHPCVSYSVMLSLRKRWKQFVLRRGRVQRSCQVLTKVPNWVLGMPKQSPRGKAFWFGGWIVTYLWVMGLLTFGRWGTQLLGHSPPTDRRCFVIIARNVGSAGSTAFNLLLVLFKIARNPHSYVWVDCGVAQRFYGG